MIDTSTLDLVGLVDLLKQRSLRAVDVMQACLERIDEAQPRLNAFISIDRAEAMAAAARADWLVARGLGTGPLHGAPLAHKDMFYRQGRVSTCGTSILRSRVAARTSAALQRLDAAGAIQVGALNMAEFAAGPTGHNAHYGDCRNPWNPDYITGGSSSGSGVAVAARLVFGALGSDTGGSVRLPAAMCGAVGLKPTHGRISRYGIMPRAWSMDTVGPMTRTVRDCALLTYVLAGADPRDPECSNEPVPDYLADLARGIRGLRVGRPRSYFCEALDPEVAAALDDSSEVLRSEGAEIVDIELSGVDDLFGLAQIILKAEAYSLHEAWIRDRPGDYDVSIRSPIEDGAHIPAVRYIQALRQRASMLKKFEAQAFSACEVLLTPVFQQRTPTLAASRAENETAATENMQMLPRCTRPFSYLGLPALTVPCGFQSNGLPIGLQLIAPAYQESLLFRTGHALQEATRWHLETPPLCRPLSFP
jgi:aspartyl-tRNA(Asn)/glutamyl-tRNA(Gln) amidotransferase subunit A